MRASRIHNHARRPRAAGRAPAWTLPVRVPVRLAAAARVAGAVALLLVVFGPGARGVTASAAWNAATQPLERLPVVRQTQPTSCGPASLATLSTLLGTPRTEAELLALARMSEGGVTLAEFARLAHLVDLKGAWYSVDAPLLARAPTPFVAHLSAPAGERPAPELGHMVVVVAVSHGYAVIADPAEGAFVAPLSSLARRFSGRVYLLEGAA